MRVVKTTRTHPYQSFNQAINMQKKILVTGGTGYIGSHTVVLLQNMGYEVVIVDNLSNSHIQVLDQIEKITGKRCAFEKVDVCNKAALMGVFEKYKTIHSVIHFAAYKAVGESSEFPLKYYHNNITGLLNLLEVMERAACKQLVFSSSCTVYGQPDTLPVIELSPLKQAASPYGNTKRISEDIIRDQAATGILNAISLRYFNPIGAHDSALIGELPLGVPNNLVPFLTQTAIGKRECLQVFGDDYNTPDGTGIRDYIHVTDLAQAHLDALKWLGNREEHAGAEVFNVGTGTGYSVMEIIKTFERVNGVKVNYQISPRRAGDIEKVWANPQKANSQLGWRAKYGLEQMLASAWKWEKSLMDKQ